jgi:hypothetical protein
MLKASNTLVKQLAEEDPAPGRFAAVMNMYHA